MELEKTIVSKLNQYDKSIRQSGGENNPSPKVDFNFTHYEVFNKQIDEKYNFLK